MKHPQNSSHQDDSSGKSLTTRVAKSVAWLFAAKIVVRATSFIGILIVARLLTPEDFGLVTLALSTSLIVAAMMTMPIGQPLIKFRDVTDDDWNTAWSLSVGRGVVAGSVVAGLGFLLPVIYDDERLTPIMLVLGASIAFQDLKNIRFLQFEKDLKLAPSFVVDTAARIAAFVMTVAVAFATGSYWALVLGDVTMKAVTVVLSFALGPKVLPRFCLRSWRRLLGFSIWLSAGQIVIALRVRLEDFFIAHWLGKAVLGPYALGREIANLPVETITPFSRALFPAFSEIQHDRARLSEAYLKVQSVIFAVGLPVGVGLSLVADHAVPLVLGPQWMETIPVVQVLAVTTGLQTLIPGVYPVILSAGTPRQLFWREFVFLMIWLPSILLGLIFGGLMGLLIAQLISRILFVALTMSLVRAVVGVSIARSLRMCRRSFVACGVMSAVVVSLGALPATAAPLMAWPLWQVLSLEVILGVLTYSAIHVGLWFAEGRPDGVESFVLSRIRQARGARSQ